MSHGLGSYQANLARFYHAPAQYDSGGDPGPMPFTPHKMGDYKGAKVFGRYKERAPNAIDELSAKMSHGPDGPNQDYAPMSIPTGAHDTELDAVRYGEAVPVNPSHVADQVANNQQAENVRFGGVYGPVGLERASNEAALNASDRQMLRGHVISARGIGGIPAANPGAY